MSSPSSHLYETLYVLKAGISDTDAATIHQKVDNVITKFQGKISTRDDWGTKELAYPIEKEKSGKYNLVVYSGTSGVVEEIERHFKILDDVIRYITVNVEPEYDYGNVKKQIALAEEELAKAREFRKKEGGFGDRGGFRDRDGGGGGGFRDRDGGGGGGGFRGDRDGGGGRDGGPR